jgi:hypothetical protein
MDVVTSNYADKIFFLNVGRSATADEAFALVNLDWVSGVGVVTGISNAPSRSRSDRPVSNVDPMAVDRRLGAVGLGLPSSIGDHCELDRHCGLVMD